MLTHDAKNTAAREIWGSKYSVLRQEQIGHGTFNHIALSIKHQTFRDLGIRPLITRHDLLQAIQMLDTRKRWIPGKPYCADPHLHPPLSIACWIVRPWMEGEYPGRRDHLRKSVASVPRAPGQDQFEHSAIDALTELRRFRLEQRCLRYWEL